MSRSDDKDEEREERIRALMERAQKQLRPKSPPRNGSGPPRARPANTVKKAKKR